MKSFIFIAGILLGSVLGIISMTNYAKEAKSLRSFPLCEDGEVAICVPYGIPSAHSGTQRLDKNIGEPITKVILRKEIQLRIYATDGSYMFAQDHEYIGTDIGDEITSSNWIRDKK